MLMQESAGSLMRKGGWMGGGIQVTWHILWAVFLLAGDTQLALIVKAPAFDAVPGYDRARVSLARGYGDSGDALMEKGSSA